MSHAVRSRVTLIALLLSGTWENAPADFLERVNRTLSVEVFDDQVRLQLTGLLDLESYLLEPPPPALIESDDHFLFNPRLTVFLDAQLGTHLYAFVQARLDRGFDPTDEGAQVRLNE